jgi:hypothetical protein
LTIEWRNRFDMAALEALPGHSRRTLGAFYLVRDGVEVAEVYQDVHRPDPKSKSLRGVQKLGPLAPWIAYRIAKRQFTSRIGGDFHDHLSAIAAVEDALLGEDEKASVVRTA